MLRLFLWTWTTGAAPDSVIAVLGRAYSLTSPIVARDITPDVEGRSVEVGVKAHSARAVIP